VQKIVQDHGGEVLMERTADAHTVFRIIIPGRSPQGSAVDGDSNPARPAGEPRSEDRASEKSIRHSDT